MFDRWIAELQSTVSPWWLIPVAGVAAAALILLFGSVLSRRGRPPQAAAAPDPYAVPKTPDRRVSHRREGSAVTVDITDEQRQGAPVRGWVVDRSVGGLCIEVTEPYEVGAVLNIRPSTASAVIPWTAVEVRSCRQDGDRWQLGCQYVRTPPYSILLLFG